MNLKQKVENIVRYNHGFFKGEIPELVDSILKLIEEEIWQNPYRNLIDVLVKISSYPLELEQAKYVKSEATKLTEMIELDRYKLKTKELYRDLNELESRHKQQIDELKKWIEEEKVNNVHFVNVIGTDRLLDKIQELTKE